MSETASNYPMLPAIAAELAKELRNMPCACIAVGSWPLFKAEATGKHKPKTCGRCVALERYEAFLSIVQLPKGPGPALNGGSSE